MLERYSHDLPLIDGAVEAVKRLADRWPLGVASSSNRELIDRVLERRRAGAVLPRHGLLRRGRAREACAGRLSRGCAPARRRPAACRRDRGLRQRDSLRPCRRYARRCDSQSRLPAAAGRPRAGRRRSAIRSRSSIRKSLRRRSALRFPVAVERALHLDEPDDVPDQREQEPEAGEAAHGALLPVEVLVHVTDLGGDDEERHR